MSEPIDQEVEAIRVVLTALAPLSEKARGSVLEYVVRRLNLVPLRPPGATTAAPGEPPPIPTGEAPPVSPLHIKQFKEQKGPRSANEMAAVVGFFLANVAPGSERKNTVNHSDIATHFKIAEFPLPKHTRQTLPNAKNAGYFDLVGEGEYRLNAVGHNLVVHSLPRGQHTKVRKSGGPHAIRRIRKATRRRIGAK